MKYHSNIHTNLCEPKSGLSCRKQVVHTRPHTPQGGSIAKPETSLLIILSIQVKDILLHNITSVHTLNTETEAHWGLFASMKLAFVTISWPHLIPLICSSNFYIEFSYIKSPIRHMEIICIANIQSMDISISLEKMLNISVTFPCMYSYIKVPMI